MNRAFSNTRNFTQRCPAVLVITLASLCLAVTGASEPSAPVTPVYHIYAGNTHSHTSYTWSHGTQWPNSPSNKMVVKDSTSYPGPNAVPKPDWKKYQGPPADHFALAKAHGYDFYIVTDHSQEAPLQPVSPTNPAWVDTAKAATAATNSHFLALRGFENSENNGPGGKGHLNVINSAEYLNALSPGIDLPYLYQWLKTARPDGAGPVVASFNHPGPHQYDDWADRDPQITEIITMLEVINSNNKIHYEAFVNALDKGWKVAPICGNDNHGTGGITQHTSRMFVLATSLTKGALLEALQHRRTYAALDGNIQCRYSVNGAIMGSTLDRPDIFHFAITIRDPDTSKPGDRITKIDIVKDGGQVVEAYRPAPAHSVTWNPTIQDATNHYFFVRVWNERGGDAKGENPNEPIAWLAPVWTGR
jgi:hypothetical protein